MILCDLTNKRIKANKLRTKTTDALNARIKEVGLESITVDQLCILRVAKIERINAIDLSHKLGLKAPSVSRMLSSLKKSGFIGFIDSEIDKRSKDIILTNKSNKFIDAYEEVYK